MTENLTGRAGVVAVVGRTNVGKSTLLNALLGEKVSIVSDTVQTTRNVIRAILTEERGQIVFLDTPGIHKAEGDLGKNLNKMARSAMGGADAALLVLDASSKIWQEDEGWMRRLMKDDRPCVILLNKTDRGTDYLDRYKECWSALAEEKGSTLEPVWVEGSALTGGGVPELSRALFERLPEGPHLFPEEILTDYPRMLNISDVIREKYFDRLHDELPHCLAIWVENIEETPKKWIINAIVYVERHSQKGIVIGEKGRLLKSVQYQANPKAMTGVLGIVYRAIATHLSHKAGLTKPAAQTGAVTLIQHFGSALNLNIHFHMLFLDGVYTRGTKRCPMRFLKVKSPTQPELTRLTHTIARRVARYLERQGLIDHDAGNIFLSQEAVDASDEDPTNQLLGS